MLNIIIIIKGSKTFSVIVVEKRLRSEIKWFPDGEIHVTMNMAEIVSTTMNLAGKICFTEDMMMSFPSDLLVSMEFVIILMIAVFFSMMYELNRDLTWSGIIASMTWMVMGMYWFVVFAQNPSSSIGLLFVGIGLIYIMRFIVDLISMRHAGRKIAGFEKW